MSSGVGSGVANASVAAASSRPHVETYLAEFESKKTEFVAYARMASMILFREGRLQEADKICDAVLCLSPDDVETRYLKAKVQRFIDHPDELDLAKLKSIDIGIVEKPEYISTSRGLLRSVSERKPSRRRAQVWSITSFHTSTTNGSNLTSTCDEVFEVTENGISDSDGRANVHRDGKNQNQSDSSVNVLQKIQCFEKHARNVSARKSSIGKQTELINTGSESLPPMIVRKESLDEPVPVQDKTVIPNLKKLNDEKVPSPQFKYQRESIGDNTNVVKIENTPVNVMEHKNLTNRFKIDQCNNETNYTYHTASPVVWIEGGLTVNKEMREELEREFFRSTLLTSACLATFDGNILGVSRGCRITMAEIQIIVGGMQRREYITSSVVTLAGQKYSCLSGTGHVVRARSGKLGINFTTFKRTLVICFYSHPVLPKPIGKLVQHIEKFLSDSGY